MYTYVNAFIKSYKLSWFVYVYLNTKITGINKKGNDLEVSRRQISRKIHGILSPMGEIDTQRH